MASIGGVHGTEHSQSGVRDPVQLGDPGFTQLSGAMRLGQYDIVARLGQGGMAGVYLAVSQGAIEGVRKLVVLKVLHESFRGRQAYVDMFMREAKIAVDLAHPNIVHTYTVGQEDGQYCIVMEYLDGVPLSVVLRRAAARPLKERLPLLGAVCMMLGGLHYLHEFRNLEGNHLQLIHRDLKPANIFIGFDGHVKLLDFGVAKMAAPGFDQTAGMSVKGTVQYAAPETLVASQPIDRRFDIFTSGLIVWEIATGRPFWDGRNQLQVLGGLAGGEMAEMLETAVGLPEPLLAICRKALAFAPADRYPSALGLKRDLVRFLGESGHRLDTEHLARMVTRLFRDTREQRRELIGAHFRRSRGDAEASASNLGFNSVTQTEAEPSSPSNTEVEIDSPVQTAKYARVDGTGAEIRASSWSDRRHRAAIYGGAIGLLVAVFVGYLVVNQPATQNGRDPRSAEAPRSGEAMIEPRPEREALAIVPPHSPPEVPDEIRQVALTASPPEAELVVDGKPLAGNPAVLSLDEEHDPAHVIVRAEGYEPEVVAVRFDGPANVEVALKRLPSSDSSKRSRRAKARARRARASSRSSSAAKVAPKTPRVAAAETTTTPRPGDDLVTRTQKPGESKIDSEIPWD